MARSNRVLNGWRKVGFHSGRLHAHNILAGRADVELSSGDGTETITFAKPMRDDNYLVLTCPQESTAKDDLCISVSDKTPQSFVINVTSTNHTDPITVGFLVLDSYRSGPQSNNPSRFGVHSGYAHFRNLQWGMIRATLNAEVTVTLPHPMKHTPLVFASIDDDTAATAGFVYIGTNGAQTRKSFKLDNTGVVGPSGTVDITWVAFDPGFDFGTADLDAHTKGVGGHKLGGSFGIHSGDFRAKNFIGGFHSIATSSNNGSEAVELGQVLRGVPIVFVFLQKPVNDSSAVCYASNTVLASVTTISGFTIGVENTATADAGPVYLGYLAIDSEWLPTKEPESEQVA